MVRVSVLAGPYAGQVIEASFGQVTPQDILCGVAGYRYPWATDYSDATSDERALWERQEISMKLVRALSTGATVEFLGKEYRSDGIEGSFEVASQIEDDILGAGKISYLESESNDRVILGAH